MADSPLTPTMQGQLEQLLQLQTDRSARTSPVHQAAMAMAQRMAPGYAQSAMTAPSSLPMPTGSSSNFTSLSSPGGPGLGTTSAALLAAALLKPGSPLLALLKKLAGVPDEVPGGVKIPGGEFDPNKVYGAPPKPAGLPGGGGGAQGGGMSDVPGYFRNPDGSLVAIPGDPANGGGYGGGLFPVTPEDPRHD